ncbi:uncharacterized protein LOC124434932 [Xenia sp. Carnegie-2017]|uniref:uncharacterized protein LOC124434932 n=1 Tax=Xenia sp. Carnegie-2017 TaxID=2897299 RepID=UPI001F042F74|nr:uncharacterized protein LOC124434932 [Xenia sp. Carnegie-2017]
MFESKHSKKKRLLKKGSVMFGVKEGHTVYCDEDCSYTHHEILLLLTASKRNDPKSAEKFKQSVLKAISRGWNKNGDIEDSCTFFRFPLVHWAAVYGKLSALQWLLNQGFNADVINSQGETALHRLIACQAHERAVDPRMGRGRRYSLNNIVQVFTKVLDIFMTKSPRLLLRFDYVERNTPFSLCLKLLKENQCTCPRLAHYYQALLKVLCESLVHLLKQKKLREEYIRKGFLQKDLDGNTVWHLAAMSQNETVNLCFDMILKNVVGFDLSVSNNFYETPILVALKNNNQRFAALIEAYKFSSCSVPIVKMELQSEECLCEHRKSNCTSDRQGALSSNVSEKLSSSCTDVSVTEATTLVNYPLGTVEQSFMEKPQTVGVLDEEKVVFTREMKLKVALIMTQSQILMLMLVNVTWIMEA